MVGSELVFMIPEKLIGRRGEVREGRVGVVWEGMVGREGVVWEGMVGREGVGWEGRKCRIESSAGGGVDHVM